MLILYFRFGPAITNEGWIYLSGIFSKEKLEKHCDISDLGHGVYQSIADCYKAGKHGISDVHEKNDHCQVNNKDEWEQPKGLACF